MSLLPPFQELNSPAYKGLGVVNKKPMLFDHFYDLFNHRVFLSGEALEKISAESAGGFLCLSSVARVRIFCLVMSLQIMKWEAHDGGNFGVTVDVQF